MLAGCAFAEYVPFGDNLVESDPAYACPKRAIALSADGGTLAIGVTCVHVPPRTADTGGAWVYQRKIDGFSRFGPTLVGDGLNSSLGTSVALSADGTVLAVGGASDDGFRGATWVFQRASSTATFEQHGEKVVGSSLDASPEQGWSVALSATGNVLVISGPDDFSIGATWMFRRDQRKADFAPLGAKVVANETLADAHQGWSIAVAAGGTFALGMEYGGTDPDAVAAWVFSGLQPSSAVPIRLTGAVDDAWAYRQTAVALSGDGSTLAVGVPQDADGIGATWLFQWSGEVYQPVAKLVGSGRVGESGQGHAVALSADGDTLVVGAPTDANGAGGAWVFRRPSPTAGFEQVAKLVASDGKAQGVSVASSSDGSVLAVGGTGATWVYQQNGSVAPQAPQPAGQPAGQSSSLPALDPPTSCSRQQGVAIFSHQSRRAELARKLYSSSSATDFDIPEDRWSGSEADCCKACCQSEHCVRAVYIQNVDSCGLLSYFESLGSTYEDPSDETVILQDCHTRALPTLPCTFRAHSRLNR